MGLFGGKATHPLADQKEAKRVLEALPPNDPYKALEELSHWLESVATAEGFKSDARLQLLFLLDDTAQPRLRKLGAEYVAATRPSRFQENRLWTTMHGYWKQAAWAYARSVDQFVQNAKGAEAAKSLLPQLVVRALRSFAQQIKWMHLRYGPVDLESWGVLNRVYAFAETRQIAQAKVAGYGAGSETTAQVEFMKAAMFSASSPDGLLPIEVDLAERVIAQLAARFVLGNAPGPELVYWTDLGQAVAPARVTRAPAAASGLRCFGAGSAFALVSELAERVLTGGQVAPEINLGGSYDAEVVLETLRHLAMYWSPQPPERKAQRHAVKSRLAVTHGYEGVVAVLGGSDSLDFDNKNSESWIVENVSAGGFGAVVPQVKGDWLRVGALLAMQPEGGTNWVLGVVRRVNKTGGQQARVGIETLSKAPVVSQFAISGAKGAAASGVLLKNGEAAEARIVLRPGVFAPAQNLEVSRGTRQHVYLPQAVAERGEDYEIARFREMIRES